MKIYKGNVDMIDGYYFRNGISLTTDDIPFRTHVGRLYYADNYVNTYGAIYLPSECGTHKAVTARFRPWLSGECLNPFKVFSIRCRANVAHIRQSRPYSGLVS